MRSLQEPIWYIVNVEGAVVWEDRYLVILRPDNEVHAPGVLALPGGKVEAAGVARDILEETLRRELREEVGLQVGPELVFLESKSFLSDDGSPVIDLVFLGICPDPDSLDPDPSEVAGCAWMTAAEVETHPDTTPWLRQSVRLAEQKRLFLGW